VNQQNNNIYNKSECDLNFDAKSKKLPFKTKFQYIIKMRKKVKKFFIQFLQFCLSLISQIDATTLNVGPRNLDRFYLLTNSSIEEEEEGDQRIFSSTTLVVNNSTVIRAITFIIGSLLIFLPLLLVAGLKMAEEGGSGYGYSGGTSYHGDFSSFGDGWEEYQSKKRRRKSGKRKKKLSAIVNDNETSRSSAQSKLGRFYTEYILFCKYCFVLFFSLSASLCHFCTVHWPQLKVVAQMLIQGELKIKTVLNLILLYH
jgi:hypothetical protein